MESSRLDEIENRNKNFFSLTCRSFVDDMDYMIKLARKAEEMAKFYAEMPEKNVEFSDYKSMVDQYSANETNKIGYKAREFLLFLEKGDE